MSTREFVQSIRCVCRETGRFCEGYCHAPPVCEWCGDGHRVKVFGAGGRRSVVLRMKRHAGEDGVGEVGVGGVGTREAIGAQQRSIRERKRERKRKEKRKRKRRRARARAKKKKG